MSVIGIILELVSQSFNVEDGDGSAGQVGLLWSTSAVLVRGRQVFSS